MKILYIKSNSERAKDFQLQTIIYEVDGKKYVKKRALTKEAKSHIENMQKNRAILDKSINKSNIEFVPIVKQDENSITFEFIDGQSLEDRLKYAKDNRERKVLLAEYQDIIFNGFKTNKFNHKTAITNEFKEIFGEYDYKLLDGIDCYDSACNLDMIFSNLIYFDNKLFIIDYEWSFKLNLPVEYILYRTYQMMPKEYKNLLSFEFNNAELFHKMERYFIDNFVMRDGFYFNKHKFLKLNLPIEQELIEKNKHINQLESHLKKCKKLYNKLDEVGKELEYAQKVVNLRDKQIEHLLLKNRVKRVLNKINPLNKKGIKDPFNTTIEKIKTKTDGYSYMAPLLTLTIKEELESFNKKPLISIVMPVYNVDSKWLKRAIESIQNQWYGNWELCIADDKSTNEETINYLKSIDDNRIKIKFLEQNLNISGATNAAIELSNGEYIALMDNDDEITPDALYEIVKAINEKDADFIYSDEDFINTDDVCSNPHYKPDFSPDLLLSHNYITHFTCFKRELLEKVGKFDSRYDGAQDYELFLRLTEIANNIYHIPKVLYHWRMIEGSTSANSEAKPEALLRGQRALESALKRRGIDAVVKKANINHYFKVEYQIKNNPLVSIIIPFKDKPELLKMCIESILKNTTYNNFEIIGVSNNSSEEATFKLMKELKELDPRVKFYEYNVEFNYAQINNYAVKEYSKGEHILLLNNDIEVISPNWLESMLEHSQREEVGCVGAKLYYPDNTIQHAGIIIGLGGYAGHSHKHLPREHNGYFNRLMVVQNLSAVTAACLMIKKSIYLEVEGMDEIKFKVAYNDVDFCLRVREKGYLNIFTPYAELYHHESISRGYETTPEKIARFQTEKDALYERHKEILTNGDPYYNPNLCHDKEDFSICPK